MSTENKTPDLTIPNTPPVTAPAGDAPQGTTSTLAISDKVVNTLLTREELDKFTESVASANGEIPPDLLKTITDRGVPADVVKGYVEGRVAVERLKYSELIADVGGEAEFAKIRQWASTTMKPEDRDRINGYVKARNFEALKAEYRGLKTAFVGANGADPARTVSGSSSGGPIAFSSQAEFQRALRDPRYANDPGYQKQVLERLRVSNI
jgi:hypothetical protein